MEIIRCLASKRSKKTIGILEAWMKEEPKDSVQSALRDSIKGISKKIKNFEERLLRFRKAKKYIPRWLARFLFSPLKQEVVKILEGKANYFGLWKRFHLLKPFILQMLILYWLK